jgi:hypothetical protein
MSTDEARSHATGDVKVEAKAMARRFLSDEITLDDLFRNLQNLRRQRHSEGRQRASRDPVHLMPSEFLSFKTEATEVAKAAEADEATKAAKATRATKAATEAAAEVPYVLDLRRYNSTLLEAAAAAAALALQGAPEGVERLAGIRFVEPETKRCDGLEKETAKLLLHLDAHMRDHGDHARELMRALRDLTAMLCVRGLHLHTPDGLDVAALKPALERVFERDLEFYSKMLHAAHKIFDDVSAPGGAEARPKRG